MKRHHHFIWFVALMSLNFTLIVKNLPTETNTLFSGSGNCTMCHSGQGDVFMSSDGRDVSPVYHWQSSMMGNAAKDPYWQAKVSSEVEENPHLKEIIEDKCATCHAPMGRTEAIYNGRSSYTFAEVKSDALSQDGVSCTLCHQVDPDNLSKEESFSGHYEVKNTKTIYGPYENPFANPMVNNTGYTPVHGNHIESSALCATCHTLSTPYVDQEGNVAGYFPEQMPYYEWLNSHYPDQKTSCQKCHMPALDESMKISSLPPNLVNKRSPIFEHHFVGGNTFVSQLMQSNREALGINSGVDNMDTTIYYTLSNLKQNTLEITTQEVQQGQDIIVNVTLKNKTGHKLPTGFPSRRLWVHFVAYDEKGDTVFESGAYNKQGEILSVNGMEYHHDTIDSEDEVQIYEAVLGNTNNEETTILLEASQYLKDNRLPPLGFTSDQPYDSLIAITGAAANDPNFNHSGASEGTGADVVSYRFSSVSNAINYSVNICYQSIKPDYVGHLSASSTSESQRFTQMYNAEKAAKVDVITTLDKQISQSMLEEDKASKWTIGPNPSTDYITINNISDDAVNYSIYTLDGICLEHQVTTNRRVPLNHLEKGAYLLTVSSASSSRTFKIIHQ